MIKVTNNLNRLIEKRASLEPMHMAMLAGVGGLTGLGFGLYQLSKIRKNSRKQLADLEEKKRSGKPFSAQDKANYDVLKDFEAGGEI